MYCVVQLSTEVAPRHFVPLVLWYTTPTLLQCSELPVQLTPAVVSKSYGLFWWSVAYLFGVRVLHIAPLNKCYKFGVTYMKIINVYKMLQEELKERFKL